MISEAQRKRMEENRAAALARIKNKTDSQAAIALHPIHNPSNYGSHCANNSIDSFCHNNPAPLSGPYPGSITEVSQWGNPLTYKLDNTENCAAPMQKTPYYVGHHEQQHAEDSDNPRDVTLQHKENPNYVGYQPIYDQLNSSLVSGPGPISHRHFTMEADRRYPACKKTRMSSDLWVPSIQGNSKCQPIPTVKQDPSVKRVEVTLELQAIDQFSVVVLNPSDAARDILRLLLASATPIFEASFPSPILFHFRDYKKVLCILRGTPCVLLQPLPQSTLSVIQKMHQANYSPQHWVPFMPNHITDAAVDELVQHLPCRLKETLLPFQLEGVKYGLKRGGRCLIADEMGVGKTIQAISLAACYAKEGSILIACPASLRLMWAEELERWLPFILPVDVHLVFGHKTRIPDEAKTPKVVVISYTMLRRLKSQMLAHKWAMLIVDESHNLRCTRSKVECEETTAILDISQNVKRIVLLSGTPSLSRPFDIFHQINILSPGLLGRSKYDFAKSYCLPHSTECNRGLWPKDFSKGQRLQELNILMRETVMVRRLKGDVLVQLPPKRRQVIRLTLEASDMLEVKRFKDRHGQKNEAYPCTCGFSSHGGCDCDDENECQDAQTDYRNGEGKVKRQTMSYQEIGVAKLRGVCEWLSNHPSLSENVDSLSTEADKEVQKMIIFGHHLKVLDSIQEMVHRKGLEYVRVDGSTLTTDRHKAVDEFRNVDKIKVAIIGLTAGGVGLDFSSAQTVIFAELPKSASELLQAEDRAHRRGQKSAVNIYFFCAKDTADEIQWQTLSKSLERVSTMTNGSENAIEELKVDAVTESLEQKMMGSPQTSAREEHKLMKDEDNEETKCVLMQSKSSSVQRGEEKKDDGHSDSRGSNTADGKATSGTHSCNDSVHSNCVVHPTSLMFEVSANTRRIHIYSRSDSDGFRPIPLQANFLPEDLEHLNEPSHSNKGRDIPGCLKECPANLECATAFIQQWNSLRPVDQNSLLGRPLQLPLAFELECSKADNGLVKGGSKRRVTPISEISLNIPEDATWRTITLHHYSFKDRHIQQAWSSTEEPLCKLCYRACLALNAKNPEYYEDLFCRKECYQQFRMKTSQAYIRQELFALEKGVCTMCKLDCHALVEKIRSLPREQRRQHILRQAPQFRDHHRLLEKLVSDAKEGHAWHADHIVAVYEGGGECTLQNMRTLCVICHAKVTTEQNRKRRNSLNRAKDGFQATIEKFIKNWCEKRMQATTPQDGDGKHHAGDKSSEDEADSDILNIEISGSVYSRK